jgi:nitroreductase
LAALNDGRVSAEFSRVAVGAMTQNVYLAAAALQLGARYIHAIKAEEIAGALKLADGDAPICLMLLGK